MGKLRNTLAAISILLLASCGGNKDYYMFTSFHEPADEGLRYLYSEDGMHWDSIPGVWLKPELGQHRLMRDPSMVRTPDVMVLKDNTRPERNLKIAFSDSLTGPYSPSSQPFTESFVEGPSVEKLGDDYLIYFDVYKKKIYGAMCTRDFKNFTDITESVSVPVGHKHGTIFKALESDVKTLLEESKKK